MAKNTKIVPISLDMKYIDEIDKIAKEMYDGNRSALFNELVKNYLEKSEGTHKAVTDTSIIPIMLKVPSSFKGDREGLTTWLANKCHAIVSVLCP